MGESDSKRRWALCTCLAIWKAELLVKHTEHTGWRRDGQRGLHKLAWPWKRWREPGKEGSAEAS